MSDTAVIAIVNGIVGLGTAYFDYRASMYAKASKESTTKIQKQTDGMHNAMIKLTADASFKEGEESQKVKDLQNKS